MDDHAESLSLPLPGSKAAEHRHVAQCVISFGSNLGDRRELLAAAASRIASWDVFSDGDTLRTSRLFETPPIGGPGGQEPFLNAVGVFQTDRPARDILDRLQALEAELGRERRRRWDARSIDLDVVLHGELVGGSTGLVVPHPRYTARQFVLRPACDVAAHFRDPRFGWTLRQLSEHLSSAVPSLALVSGRWELRERLCERLNQEHGIQVRPESSFLGPNDEQGFDPDQPWISNGMPVLPSPSELSVLNPDQSCRLPRLLVRIHRSSGSSGWPAPHLMWPNGWKWPEYRLEIEDFDWAVSELASALDSMRCSAEPVTDDGAWW